MENEISTQEQNINTSQQLGTINSKTIIFLFAIIVLGGVALGYLLYKQSQEPPIVLDEVVETIEIPIGDENNQPRNERNQVIPDSPSE